MRTLSGTATPVHTSLLTGLPAAFVGSELTVNLVEAFDDVLAPVTVLLDALDAYVDPRYAPDDFARWVVSWLAPGIAARRSADDLRARLGDVTEAMLGRGTTGGVVAAVRACTGLTPEVRDNGGVSWSRRPHAPLPGTSLPRLEVDVRIAADEPDPDALLDLVRSVVDDVKPVHVPATVRRVGD
ncbi:phage tail protein [Cellulomonas sp. URHD0024]|uniref:phage tail protein n=1 Tax=Cellulomonas sp. URHD0024 TaxID=1302620 RepID=UPI000686534C|nr:phage tail protein [Cellulomonas sp. URHD0024]